MKKIAVLVVLGMGLGIFLALNAALAQQQGPAPTFAQVSAIFNKYHCTLCHGTAKASGGLALNTYEALMKGGKAGAAVVPKDPAKSELVKRIKGQKEPRMPINGPPWLTDAETQTIVDWIAAGANKN